MAPPLNKSQEKFMNQLYYVQFMKLGRDKLFFYIRDNHPKQKISRRQIAEWLEKQEANQLFQRRKRVGQIQTTVLSGPRQQMMIDLVDMQTFTTTKKHRYILTAIDSFTRKVWAVPLKSKEAPVVLKEMKGLMKKWKKIRVLRSDNGNEFKNKFMTEWLKKIGVKQVFGLPSKPTSQGQIEVLNRSLGQMLLKTVGDKGMRDWDRYLQKVVANMNRTINTTIKMTPNQAEINRNWSKVKETIEAGLKGRKKRPSLQVGDHVRVAVTQTTRTKKKPRFSLQVYEVVKVLRSRKTVSADRYRLKEKGGGEIKKFFFGDELLRIPKDTVSRRSKDVYAIISKLLKYDREKKMIYVRWRKQGKSWVPLQNIALDQPKLLKKEMPQAYKDYFG